jgi:glycerol-3-phosphate O-acyltransferase
VIARGHELGYLETLRDPIGEIIALREGQSGPLTYFRNNILHLLTLPSLIAAAFSRDSMRNRADLSELVSITLPFLHGELFSPADASETKMQHALQAMEQEGLLTQHADQWVGATAGDSKSVSLKRLGDIVMPGIERYCICVAVLMNQIDTVSITEPNAQQPDSLELTQESLESQCADCAERLAATEGRNRRELHDKNLFGQFVDTLDQQGLIKRDGDKVIPLPKLQTFEHQTRQLLDDSMHQAILRASAARAQRGARAKQA